MALAVPVLLDTGSRGLRRERSSVTGGRLVRGLVRGFVRGFHGNVLPRTFFQ